MTINLSSRLARFWNRCGSPSLIGSALMGILFSVISTEIANAEPVLTFQRTSDCYVSTTGRVSALGFTIESWIRQTTADSENQVYTQDNSGGTGRIFYSLWSGKPTFQISGTRYSATTNLTLNTWYHFAVTRDTGGNVRMYLNGQLIYGPVYYNKDLPATSANTQTSIGLLLRAKQGYRGDIGELRLWNTVRSQTEIQANMNHRLTGTETGLAHYWPFDEGMGSTTYDHTGNANGTITGATWSNNLDFPLGSQTGSWISPNSGSWSDSANWLNGIIPNTVSATAFFTNALPTTITVANDITGLSLFSLFLQATNGITFTGNMLAMPNTAIPSRIETAQGSHTFALPIQLSSQGLVVTSTTPATLVFSDTLSGTGPLTVNPSVSGGGRVTFSATNTYTGATILGSGTVSAPSLETFGTGLLSLGPGTLHLTGSNATSDRPLTVNAGSGKAAILRIDHDLMLTGPMNNAAGAIIKSGPGTLTYASSSTATLGNQQSANMGNQTPYPSNGDSPVNGFGCFTVANGKMILGAHPAQTNFFNQEVTVGAYTTDQAGQETTGELEFVGGYHRFNSYLDIGYYNGTTATAPTPRQPTVTIREGATVSASGFIIAFGYNYFGTAYPNTHAILNIAGGSLTVDNDFRFGDQRGSSAAPMHATINLSSGILRHTGGNGSLRMGWRSDTAGSADSTLNLSGGLMDVANDLKMGGSLSTARINLEGGTLRVRNLVHDQTNGISRVSFNGGIFQPNTSGYTLSGLTVTTVSTNGAIIDTSLADYTIAQNLMTDPDLAGAEDGGLTKLGAKTLIWASTNSTYQGPTTVSNGILKLVAALPSTSALFVAPAGEVLVGGSATQTMTFASLTLASGGTLSLGFTTNGSAHDQVSLPADATIATGRVGLYLAGTTSPFSLNGTYTLMTYSGTAPDISAMTCANAVYGKKYTFAAADGNVTVTISNNMLTASLWNTNSDGAWSTTANWTLAPVAGGSVRFDDIITHPVTVTTSGETIGALYFNNTNTYTLAGSGLTLDNGTSSATIAIESGVHAMLTPLTCASNATISLASATQLTLGSISGSGTLSAHGDGIIALTTAPQVAALTLDIPMLAVSNTLAIAAPITGLRSLTIEPASNTTTTVSSVISGNVGLTKKGASTLMLAAANTYSGVTRVDNGTLVVPSLADGGQPSSIGTSTYSATNVLLGPATLRYTGPSNVVWHGITLQADSAHAAVIRVDEGSDLALTGWINSTSGGFVKTGAGTLRIAGNANNILHRQGVTDGRLNIGPNGEGPTQGFFGLSVAEGRLVMGAPFQTNTVYSRLVVGINTTTSAAAETAGELEVCNGVLNMNGQVLAIGRNNGTSTTAPEGLSSRLIVTEGIITNASFVSLGYNGMGLSGFNPRPVLDMSGGKIYVNNFYIAESSGANATINHSGGLIMVSTLARFALAASSEVRFFLSGDAFFQTANNTDVVLPYGGSNAKATLYLNGGTLSTRNIIRQGNVGTGTIYFNGGTLLPRTTGQTLQNMTAIFVSTNGAVFDTSLASYTVAQNLLVDPDLGGTPDGGLVKHGTNMLTITGINTFRGPIDVQAGLLQARVSATNDLFVATNAAFDALGLRATVGDLTGEGTLTNGTIAVTGRLDAGTNNAPAGARMTVANLSLVKDMTFACDWTTNMLGQITNDFVAVTSTLAPEGAGTFDLGCTEADPITLPFSCTIMSYGSLSGHFIGWKAINTGIPAEKHVTTIVTASNGVVTLEIRYGGTLFLLR